jgi:toxin-antitoxin system PIN domain toxin
VIIPDVNLLLYARIAAYPQHRKSDHWWTAALNGTEAIGMPLQSLFGFIRIATNPRLFRKPMTVHAAIAAVESWLARPQVELVHPGPRHLEVAFGLLRKLGSGGDLTTDVQLAALAIENQAELYSNDSYFERFAGLRWVNPLSTS